jgi:periplasmic protein CpxP/Spy
MIRRAIVFTALCMAVLVPRAEAQRVTPPRDVAPRGTLPRQQLEARLRQRLWRVVKNRVGLSDDQMTKLAQTSRGFDERRRRLAAEERQQRLVLRREVQAGQGADQARVAAALDRVLAIQRERTEIQLAEQREFSAFMTPVQRARYAALQEQLRRRAENLRRSRAGADSAPDLDAVR